MKKFLLAAVVVHCVSSIASPDDVPVITLDGRTVLNTHADQVGVWIDSRQERLGPKLIAALKDLRVRTVRYGWQYGLFDAADLTSQVHSPSDPAWGGYFTDGRGRIAEKIGLEGTATLLDAINATGFAVVATDAINYLGEVDKPLQQLTREQRIARYSERAAAWAEWGRSHRFTHYEIGNENDISGHGDAEGVIEPWTPETYAEVARAYTTAIKQANPAAHCGINGGLLEEADVRRWFETIVATEPSLADDLDFLVAHKYEFWLDYETWRDHAEWNFGSLSTEMVVLRRRLFPKLPVHVTEIGSWKTGEIDHHYRALLMTEMLGNVYREPAVEHVQVWPTRWTTEGGVFGNSDDSELSSMGLGVKAYTAFARPILFANGFQSNVRYFASRDEQGGVTVWLINHNEQKQTLQCALTNVDVVDRPAVYQLTSPSGQPDASDTTLDEVDAVSFADGKFTLSCPPLSATIVSFSN